MRSKQYDILLVDDDEEDRMMVGEAFAELDCAGRVTMYDSSFSFHQDLVQLKTLSPLPRLIVLGYNMPGSDGAMLLTLIKSDELLQNVPVVIYTNGMTRTQEADCMVRGALKCIQKGSTYEEVVAFARLVCEEAFTQTPKNQR